MICLHFLPTRFEFTNVGGSGHVRRQLTSARLQCPVFSHTIFPGLLLLTEGLPTTGKVSETGTVTICNAIMDHYLWNILHECNISKVTQKLNSQAAQFLHFCRINELDIPTLKSHSTADT